MDPNAAVKWAMAFLPGFVALFVFGQIVDSGDIKEFEFVFYLVLLTMITWAVAWPILFFVNRCFGLSINVVEMHPIGTPFFIVLGFFVGGFIGYLSDKNTFYATIRGLPFTSELNVVSKKPVSIFVLDHNAERTLHKNVDTRASQERDDHAWVRILVDGGEEYHGWPGLFSKGREFDELFLTPACKVVGGSLTKHEGAGVLLFSQFIKGVEFMDRDNSECACEWGDGSWDGNSCS